MTLKFPHIIGLIIILMGLTQLFNNLGITSIGIGGILSKYWPLIFIYLGLNSLTGDKKGEEKVLFSEKILALILLFLGVTLLGRNLNLFKIDLSFFWKVFWPLLLIFFGYNLLRGVDGQGGTSWAVMGGIERDARGWKLENKHYFAFMGGVDLDLEKAEIPEGETVLVLTAIMGGIDVRAPKELAIECEGFALLGGVDFFGMEGGGILMNRHFSNPGVEGSTKKLVIRCKTMMGGISIRES